MEIKNGMSDNFWKFAVVLLAAAMAAQSWFMWKIVTKDNGAARESAAQTPPEAPAPAVGKGLTQIPVPSAPMVQIPQAPGQMAPQQGVRAPRLRQQAQQAQNQQLCPQGAPCGAPVNTLGNAINNMTQQQPSAQPFGGQGGGFSMRQPHSGGPLVIRLPSNMFGGQGGVQAFSNDPFDADDEMDDAIEMMREMMARMMGGAAYQPQHPAQAPVSVNAPSFANAPAAVSAPSSAKAAAKTAAGQAPARPMGRSLVNSGVSSTYIQDKNNEYVIQLNMPGMQKSDIKTEVRNNMLTVSAVSKSESSQNGSGYSGASYCSGSFSASMSLPEDANSDKMKVDYNNDILTITIPKV